MDKQEEIEEIHWELKLEDLVTHEPVYSIPHYASIMDELMAKILSIRESE